VARESEQVKQQGVQTVISIGQLSWAHFWEEAVGTSSLGKGDHGGSRGQAACSKSGSTGRAQETVRGLCSSSRWILEAEFKAEAGICIMPARSPYPNHHDQSPQSRTSQ